MCSSQVSETDTRGQPNGSKLRDIRTIIVNDQSICSIYFISVSKLYRYCGAMYGFILCLGLVIAKRDFCFKTKTRPSLSYKVLEARPRLLHSRLESRARPLSNELESRARPLSNELELTRDPRLWSRGHKSGELPPAGSGAKPQPPTILVHFGRKWKHQVH